MKHWYQKPHSLLADHIRTVLILEGFSYADTNDLPLFTNGMPALLYQSAKDEQGNNQIVELTLFYAVVGVEPGFVDGLHQQHEA